MHIIFLKKCYRYIHVITDILEMKRFICFYSVFILGFSFCLSSFGKSIRITTINIRYDTSSDGINRWDNRKSLLYKYIKKNKIDIFCLQEVLPNQLKEIKEEFGEYIAVGKGRDLVKGESVPIFFKATKFERINEGTFWLSLNPDSIGSVGWGAAHPRIATWILLKDKRTQRVFMVVNTHLDHKSDQAQNMGMQLIKSRINAIMSGVPVVLTGDLNCSAGSIPYQIALHHDPVMLDCYVNAKKRHGVPYTFHAFGKSLPVDNRVRYDFVFATESFRVGRIDIAREVAIDGVYMSDHNPVLCDLSY